MTSASSRAPASASEHGAPDAGGPRLWPLAAVAVLVALAGALELLPRWAGLAHHVALPPLDLFADVRLLLALAPGHAVFWPALALAVAARTVLLAALLGGFDPRRLRLAGAVYLVALLPALLAGQLAFLSHAILFGRVLLIGALVTVVVVLLLAAAPWTLHHDRDIGSLGAALRAALRDGARGLPVLAYLGALALLGAGVVALGGAPSAGAGGNLVPVAAVGLSAGLTALAIRSLSRPPRAAAALHGGLAVGVAVVLGAALATGFTWPWQEAAVDPQPRPGSVLLASGIDSASGQGAILEIDPRTWGYSCEQTHYFSYAGPGDGQPQGDAVCPLRTGAPYTEQDTFRPFGEQVEAMIAQTADLPPPVVLAGHSQGAWVAWTAAVDERLDDLEALILVGPFPETLAGYPPPGERGPGKVPGDGFRRLIAPLLDTFGVTFLPDGDFTREVLLDPGAGQRIFARTLPDDLRVLAVPGVEDLPLQHGGRDLRGAVDGCPVPTGHADLPFSAELAGRVNAFLGGVAQPACPAWRDLIRPLLLPMGVPPGR